MLKAVFPFAKIIVVLLSPGLFDATEVNRAFLNVGVKVKAASKSKLM